MADLFYQFWISWKEFREEFLGLPLWRYRLAPWMVARIEWLRPLLAWDALIAPASHGVEHLTQLACDTRVDSFLLRVYPFLGERLGPAQLVTLRFQTPCPACNLAQELFLDNKIDSPFAILA